MTAPGHPERRRRTLTAAAVLAVVVGAVGVRTVVSGTRALERGLERVSSGDEAGAAMFLREAVGWYLPLAWWREDAIEALWTLQARQAEQGRLPDAVSTLSALRGGLFAARSVIRPDGDWLERVDAALPPLLARWEAESASAERRASPGPLSQREADFAAILARETRPSRGFGSLGVVGFIVWVSATWRGLGREGRERWRWLGAGALGLLAFLIGVAFA